MSRGPTTAKLKFSREEVLREHQWEPKPVSPKVVVPPFQRKTDDLKPDAGWMQ